MLRKLMLSLVGVLAPIASAYAAEPWSGLYVGAQVGYAWGDSVQTFNSAGTVGSTGRFDINGWVGGGTLGYNWYSQRWVFGIEGDYSGSGIKGSTGSSGSYGCGTGCSTELTSFGTLRGRLGYTWNNVLLYGTGGWAFADIKSTLNGGTANNWQNGWAVGAGAEYLLTRNWSMKVEWDYLNFGSFQWTNVTDTHFSCAGINCSTDAKVNLVRFGVNYHF